MKSTEVQIAEGIALPNRKKHSAKSTFREKSFAEFFAGIGLVREGLRSSGWDCTYANDIDPKKREIYEANFSQAAEFDERDVWDTEGVLSRISTVPFLVTASFPCIDLSVAGHYRGFDGEHSSTFFGFTEVVRSLVPRPRLMLLENVAGFLTARDGEDFRSACKEISDLGYHVDAFTLNAQLFVPQSRKRVFIVGVHEDVNTSLVSERPAEPDFGHPWYHAVDQSASLRPAHIRRFMDELPLSTGWIATPIKAPRQCKYDLSAFIDYDDAQSWWERDELERHHEMMNDRHRARIDRIIQDEGDFVGTGYRRKRKGRTRLEVRFDGIAGCLRTPRGGSARQIVVVVDKGVLKIRWMSAREYARLQGVGRFKFVENERQMLFGFGDAVCVPAIKWIDKCVLTPIYESLRD